jgi:hypothetical protein
VARHGACDGGLTARLREVLAERIGVHAKWHDFGQVGELGEPARR